MRLERFRGTRLQEVVTHLRRTLGRDAIILRNEIIERRNATDLVEVVAMTPADMTAFRRQLNGPLVGGLTAARRVHRRRHIGPYVIALVGPAGAGKTTTAMKLAMNEEELGTASVGIVTLDTISIGAVEQIETYAEITHVPLEVAYHPSEIPAILERMRDLDVVIIDAPGRPTDSADWVATLNEAAPDEVHLVLPAGVRHDVARECFDGLAPCRPTHLLLTRLDEVPRETGLAELADEIGLPTRWVSDGPTVPDAIVPAEPRIVRSLGRSTRPPVSEALAARTEAAERRSRTQDREAVLARIAARRAAVEAASSGPEVHVGPSGPSPTDTVGADAPGSTFSVAI